jgi:hypothetical protein
MRLGEGLHTIEWKGGVGLRQAYVKKYHSVRFWTSPGATNPSVPASYEGNAPATFPLVILRRSTAT